MTENGAQPRCSLNGCAREQGIGTWANVRVNTSQAITVPVCEEHWKVLRDVPR